MAKARGRMGAPRLRSKMQTIALVVGVTAAVILVTLLGVLALASDLDDLR